VQVCHWPIALDAGYHAKITIHADSYPHPGASTSYMLTIARIPILDHSPHIFPINHICAKKAIFEKQQSGKYKYFPTLSPLRSLTRFDAFLKRSESEERVLYYIFATRP